jgi:hypothetical protein
VTLAATDPDPRPPSRLAPLGAKLSSNSDPASTRSAPATREQGRADPLLSPVVTPELGPTITLPPLARAGQREAEKGPVSPTGAQETRISISRALSSSDNQDSIPAHLHASETAGFGVVTEVAAATGVGIESAIFLQSSSPPTSSPRGLHDGQAEVEVKPLPQAALAQAAGCARGDTNPPHRPDPTPSAARWRALMLVRHLVRCIACLHSCRRRPQVIPVRLGVDGLNANYVPGLRCLFQFPQCCGIIGGRPRASLYMPGQNPRITL